MNSFESIMKALLDLRKYKYVDHSNSYTKMDFSISMKNGQTVALEVKEKRQPIKMANWPVPDRIEDHNVFILDDLTARKMLLESPNSALAVQDRVLGRYFVADVLDVWSMPRTRVNRKIADGKLKGKWILDLRNFIQVEDYTLILDYFEEITEKETLSGRFEKSPDVYGSYFGETVGSGGVSRSEYHRNTDYFSTR